MKIGIFTIHHVPNYGAVLQAYALYKTLVMAGHEVTFFDHRPKRAVKYYRGRLILNHRFNPYELAKYYRFHQFIKKEMPLTPLELNCPEKLHSSLRLFDVLIAGSDQIWTTDTSSFRGYDPIFFLNFKVPNHVRRISYAASAGSSTTFEPHGKEIGQAIDQFSSVSVRDENTQQLVHSVSKQRTEMVLDPVFLHSFSEIGVLKKQPSSQYMVVYAKFLTPKEIEFIYQASNKLQMPIVCLGPDTKVDTPFRWDNLAAKDWVAAIRGAKFIFTSFYHGVVFSLKFNIPFLVFPRESKSIKIEDLLQRYQLKNHVFDPSHLSQLTDVFDGSRLSGTQSRIQHDVEASKSYLLRAVSQATQ